MDTHTFVKRKYNPSIRDFLMYICDNPHKNFPNIAEVCDDYYVMEYIEGTALSDMISFSCLSASLAKEYMLQILVAVKVMHSFKIIHRDIKPENIIITKDNTVKLIDFDISRKVISNKNCDTQLLGTVGFASPEQYGFKQTDERSDIYALGMVYNFMLTGKFPSEKTAPGQIGKIISKCVMMDKKDRYKNVDALIKDIKKEHLTSLNVFDIIPGFRTRNIYKMIFATVVYLLFITSYVVLFCEEAPPPGTSGAIDFYIGFGIMLLYNFLFFAIGTNFLGITSAIKFPIKNNILKTVILLVQIYLFAVLIYSSVLSNTKDGFLWNPISTTIILIGYVIYRIINSIIIGML